VIRLLLEIVPQRLDRCRRVTHTDQQGCDLQTKRKTPIDVASETQLVLPQGQQVLRAIGAGVQLRQAGDGPCVVRLVLDQLAIQLDRPFPGRLHTARPLRCQMDETTPTLPIQHRLEPLHLFVELAPQHALEPRIRPHLALHRDQRRQVS